MNNQSAYAEYVKEAEKIKQQKRLIKRECLVNPQIMCNRMFCTKECVTYQASRKQ